MLPAEGGTESVVILGLLNVEGTEFMMILLVALLVFGPERLPEVARKAAKAITSVRRMSDAFQNELRSAVDLPIDPLIKAQSGSSLSDVMNRLTAEAEAEEAAAKLAAKEGEADDGSSPADESTTDDSGNAASADAPAAGPDTTEPDRVGEVTADPFADSVRDPFAPTADPEPDAERGADEALTPLVDDATADDDSGAAGNG